MALDDTLLSEEKELIDQTRLVYERLGIPFKEKFGKFIKVFERLIGYTEFFSSGEILLSVGKDGDYIYMDSPVNTIDHVISLMPLGFTDQEFYDGNIFSAPMPIEQIHGNEYGLAIRTKRPYDQVWNKIDSLINNKGENNPERFPHQFSLKLRTGETWTGNVKQWNEGSWKKYKEKL